MFNQQFTYLARTVGNPTRNSYFKFLKRFLFFIGTLSHSFGPGFAVSVLFQLSVHGMLRLNLDWFLRLKDVCRFWIQNGDCK